MNKTTPYYLKQARIGQMSKKTILFIILIEKKDES